MNNHQKIRQLKRAARNNLSPAEHNACSLTIIDNIMTTQRYQNSQHIALYLPNDGEPDLTPLIETIWTSRKTCYLPVLGPRFESRLFFQAYDMNTKLVLNRFGIPQPANNCNSQCIKSYALDLVLMPLVAFDDAGHRLGMGGGFYDKTFAYRQYRQFWQKPHLMGVAFESQRVTKLKSEKWDIPLDSISTEQQVTQFMGG